MPCLHHRTVFSAILATRHSLLATVPMQPMLNIAVRAARAAGNVIVRHVDRLDSLTVNVKQRNDFVSEVDQMAEQEIIKVIRKAFPSHGILAEESGAHEGDDYLWVIDPLDGTTNFLHGFPQFGVSIAVKHKGRLEQGVVYDPLRQELFTASRGAGAHLNDRRIRVSKQKALEGALLGTGFPFKIHEHIDPYLGMLKDLFAGHRRHPPRRRGLPGSGLCRRRPCRRLLGNRPEGMGHGGRRAADPGSRRVGGRFQRRP